VSYDPDTNTLTLNNANIEMSRRSYGYGSGDKNEYGIRANLKEKDNLPGSVAITDPLTIELKGSNTIANNTPDAETTDKYGIIVFGSDVTFTGGGSLDVSMTADEASMYRGIETRMPTAYDGVTVNVNIDGTASDRVAGMNLLYTNTIKQTNGSKINIHVDKGYALDNNVRGNEDLLVGNGCVFEAISEQGPALHGNNWVKIAQETVDNRGVYVNADPTAEGRDYWDGTTDLSNYKYVRIPAIDIYTITFDPNGGTLNGSTEPVSKDYDADTKITIADAPTRDGYTFLYWKGSEYQPGDAYTVTEDHTFVAQWQKNEEPADDPADDPEEQGDKPASDETPASDKTDNTSDSGKAGSKNATPDTGDETPFGLLTLAAVAGAGVLMLRRRVA